MNQAEDKNYIQSGLRPSFHPNNKVFKINIVSFIPNFHSDEYQLHAYYSLLCFYIHVVSKASRISFWNHFLLGTFFRKRKRHLSSVIIARRSLVAAEFVICRRHFNQKGFQHPFYFRSLCSLQFRASLKFTEDLCEAFLEYKRDNVFDTSS